MTLVYRRITYAFWFFGLCYLVCHCYLRCCCIPTKVLASGNFSWNTFNLCDKNSTQGLDIWYAIGLIIFLQFLGTCRDWQTLQKTASAQTRKLVWVCLQYPALDRVEPYGLRWWWKCRSTPGSAGCPPSLVFIPASTWMKKSPKAFYQLYWSCCPRFEKKGD